jgi:hypothetical protein
MTEKPLHWKGLLFYATLIAAFTVALSCVGCHQPDEQFSGWPETVTPEQPDTGATAEKPFVPPETPKANEQPACDCANGVCPASSQSNEPTYTERRGLFGRKWK